MMQMGVKPIVQQGDWILIGSSPLSKRAVVCTVYREDSPGDVEAVYLDERDRAINEDFVWRDGAWHFLHEGPCGGYADKSARLTECVAQLRNKLR